MLFLQVSLSGAGYMVDSNKEHGGRAGDVVVYDFINARVAIFEAKYTKFWIIWKMNVILHYNRSMIRIMLRNTKMIMMRFYAMGFHFPKDR